MPATDDKKGQEDASNKHWFDEFLGEFEGKAKRFGLYAASAGYEQGFGAMDGMSGKSAGTHTQHATSNYYPSKL